MTLATETGAAREYALNVGRENTQREWICSQYDSWERNPFYEGPRGPHPEHDTDIEALDAWEAEIERCREASERPPHFSDFMAALYPPVEPDADDFPF